MTLHLPGTANAIAVPTFGKALAILTKVFAYFIRPSSTGSLTETCTAFVLRILKIGIKDKRDVGVNSRKSFRLPFAAVKHQRAEHAAGDREGVKS